MKTYDIVRVAAVVMLCGCGRGRPGQQETIPGATDSVADPLTIAGCLVPAAMTAQSGVERTSSNPPPPIFTLVDITIPELSAAAPSVSGTSGTAANPVPRTAMPKSYELVADKNRLEDLQRFANSRVEVRGSIAASTGTGTSDVGAGSARVGSPPSDVRRLQVKDVRQLAPTCASKKP